jgi:phosphonate transport system substrate-binding protein
MKKISMKKSTLILSGLVFIFLLCAAHFVYQDILNITLLPAAEPVTPMTPAAAVEKSVVFFGVISRYAPNLIYEGYQPVMDYLTENTSYSFQLKLSNSYDETIQQLASGEVQAAFLGTYIYLRAREKYTIVCILKPLNSNFEPYSRSVLFTRTNSNLHSIHDLAGKKLALPSRQSFSGNWLPRYELQKYGLDINNLDSVHYFDYHHTVVYQVLKGNFDAGVVKNRVAEDFMGKGIRFLASSEPIPGSPIVVHKNLAPEIVAAIRETLLKIDVSQPEFKELVKNWDREFAYGFTTADDRDYDHLRSIIDAVGDK